MIQQSDRHLRKETLGLSDEQVRMEQSIAAKDLWKTAREFQLIQNKVS
jgi:hypothetical protein